MSHWFYSVRECKVTAFYAYFRAVGKFMANSELQRGISSRFSSGMHKKGGSRICLCNFLLFLRLQ